MLHLFINDSIVSYALLIELILVVGLLMGLLSQCQSHALAFAVGISYCIFVPLGAVIFMTNLSDNYRLSGICFSYVLIGRQQCGNCRFINWPSLFHCLLCIVSATDVADHLDSWM